MGMISVLVLSFLASAAPQKAATTPQLGLAAPSAQRLREFPLTTLRKHLAMLRPSELADRRNLVNRDPRAISWSFDLHYQGIMQPIASARRDLVNFVESKNPQLKGQYKYEILVNDGEQDFWLPIQNGTLGYFKRDGMKKGDRIFAQTRYFGSYFEQVPKQFFLMLGYRKAMTFFK